MTTFPGSPRVLRGGIVQLNRSNTAADRIIALQYNPETLTRTLQVKGVGSEGGDRSEALRLKGPPVETIKVEAEIDATDQLEFPDQNQIAAQLGLHPQLAALEIMVYPDSTTLIENNTAAAAGTLEIAPMEAALTLFVYGPNRIVPVRLTEFSITEEAFDPNLNPIRAKISLGMRVLSIDDVGFSHKGGQLFMAYLQQKEAFANLGVRTTLGALGVSRIP